MSWCRSELVECSSWECVWNGWGGKDVWGQGRTVGSRWIKEKQLIIAQMYFAGSVLSLDSNAHTGSLLIFIVYTLNGIVRCRQILN